MKIQFVLIAAGNSFLPSITHVLFEDNDDSAIKSAEKVISALSKAGYRRFDVFKTDPDHAHLASFAVEQPAPVVTRR